MLDRDLAELYDVPVKRLNEQVSRNIERFPPGFMFQLSAAEFVDLKSQIATSSPDANLAHLKSQIATSSWGGIRKAPKVFTEQGVAMLSAVLNSPRAILVSIAIMEAFVRMRHFMMANAEVVCRMNVLEKKQMATDAKVDEILERLDSSETPLRGVFYNGQLWDARALVLSLVSRAKRSLTLATEDFTVPENCHALTNALMTVKDSSAAAVRAMLPSLRPWKPYGLTSTVVARANPGENTTTFLLVSKHTGVVIIFR